MARRRPDVGLGPRGELVTFYAGTGHVMVIQRPSIQHQLAPHSLWREEDAVPGPVRRPLAEDKG